MDVALVLGRARSYLYSLGLSMFLAAIRLGRMLMLSVHLSPFSPSRRFYSQGCVGMLRVPLGSGCLQMFEADKPNVHIVASDNPIPAAPSIR